MPSTRATIAACVATALVAGGSATAASTLITGRQVKDGTIGLQDLAPGVRAQLAKAGRPGPQGPAGAAGGFDPAKITYVQGTDTPLLVAFGRTATVSVNCPAGGKAISGGVLAIAPVTIVRWAPTGISGAAAGAGWSVTVRDDTTANGLQNVLTPTAVCVSP